MPPVVKVGLMWDDNGTLIIKAAFGGGSCGVVAVAALERWVT